MVRWVRRRDRAGRVLAVANQKPGVLSRHGISRAQADREAWTIDRAGARLGGAAAINRVLVEMGGVWPLLARMYRFRPAAVLEDVFYRWFARHRPAFHRFGITPECDEPDADCET